MFSLKNLARKGLSRYWDIFRYRITKYGYFICMELTVDTDRDNTTDTNITWILKILKMYQNKESQ